MANLSIDHDSRWSIRVMRMDDNTAVADVIRGVMTEFGAVGEGFSIEDPEVDDMFAAYPSPGAGFWVVEQSGKVEGCGGFAALTGGPPETCELRKMYFRPALRGLGAGHALMELILDRAAKAGYQQIYLETLASMSAARKLYGRHGFEPLNGPMGATGHCGCDSWMARPLP